MKKRNCRFEIRFTKDELSDLTKKARKARLTKALITYGMELMLALLDIIQGVVSSIMNAAGFGAPSSTILPAEIVTAIEGCGFFESIPLWAVTLIGGLFIWVLSFVMILSVYGRFFKMYSASGSAAV